MIPICDKQIFEIYSIMTETVKGIVWEKEKRCKIIFDNVSITKPMIENECIAIWEYTITNNIIHHINLELEISVNCYRENRNTYVLYIYASIDGGEFTEVIEIPLDVITSNSNSYLGVVEVFINNVLDYFIEKIDKISSEIGEAEKEIVLKVEELLENRLGQVIDFSFPVFKSYEDVGSDKLLEGYLEFYTTQYKVLVGFMYYINTNKLIIDSITIDAYDNNEDLLVSLLLPDIAKDLFDSS